MNVILNLNSPIKNLFGFKPEQLSYCTNNYESEVISKLNELNHSFKNNANIVPASSTGMILILPICEKEFLQLAKSVNAAEFSYDSLSRIGYIKKLKTA